MKHLKFYADWCNPCNALDRHLSEVYPEIEVTPMKISTNEDSVRIYEVRSIPTLVYVDEEGGIVDRISGFDPADLEVFLANNKLST